MGSPSEHLHEDCEAARAAVDPSPTSQTHALIEGAMLISKTMEAGFAAMIQASDEDDDEEVPPADDEPTGGKSAKK
jgi:hypothetical protein